MSSLTASYTNTPHGQTTTTEIFTHNLPSATPNPSTPDRIAYLSALHSSVKDLQADINAFLTQKMEEDKVAGAKVDDAKFEQNYGEEV
ncbi:hypothetical protein P280DRAFT_429509, partial [Massarina eburnea CBS 473.64]